MDDRAFEAHRLADEAWEKAWEDAREADRAAGRRYDHRIYAERASLASRSILAAKPHAHKAGRYPNYCKCWEPAAQEVAS